MFRPYAKASRTPVIRHAGCVLLRVPKPLCNTVECLAKIILQELPQQQELLLRELLQQPWQPLQQL